ncbi:MAG: DUF945 family protein [Proteobacteria bacterium]|nr:DUF945 family protein [Pseudomonadota bacterium]
MRNKSLAIVASLAVLTILVLGITPKVVGIGIREATIANLVDLLPPEARRQISINESAFSSGWFDSSALLDISYPALGDDVLIQLEFEIRHGPVLITPDGIKLGLAYAQIRPHFNNAEITAALAELPFELPAVQVDLLAKFNNSLKIGISIAPLNYSDNQGQLAFDGLSGSYAVNSDQSVEILLSMSKLQAQEAGSSFDFSLFGLELVSTSEQMNDILAPSAASLSIATLRSDAPYPFLLEEFSITSQLKASTAGAEKIDIFQQLKITNMEADFPVTSLSWTGEINELQTELISRYYELATDLQSQINASPGGINTPINELGQEIGLLMIRNSLVLNNEVAANVYDGDHSIDLRIHWAGLPDLTDLARLDINEVIAALTISVEVSLDLAAIMRSPAAEFIDPYVQEGYIRLDNGRILVNGSLSDSELIVNGEAVPLDQFF